MKKLTFLGVWWLASLGTMGQPLLQGLGGGVGLQGITSFHVDGETNNLLMCGFFTYANGEVVSPGVLQWNADGFTSFGCGIGWDCVSPVSQGGLGNPALSIVKWQGDIYLGGSMSFTRDGRFFRGLMRWDGTEWLPVEGLDGKVTSIRVIDDQLIVAGWFQYADTVLANGLARWDGERWHRVLDVPQFSPGDNNYVNDVAFYEGLWYLGGNLLNLGDFVRWTGTIWEPVGGGLYGTFSSVQKLNIHDGRLYVSGTFSACPPYGVPTNPGSGIVAWDGENWDDLGGGTCGAGVPDVMGVTWWNDDLYVSGRFSMIGGVPTGKLARWDGEQWCSLLPPGFFSTGGANTLAVYNDSLYVGGAFLEEGPPSLSCFAKWVGDDQTFGCGTYVGVDERETPLGWAVYPNPAQDQVQMGQPPWGTTSFRIVDALGRTMLASPVQRTLHVSDLASGSYLVLALEASGAVLGRTRLVVE